MENISLAALGIFTILLVLSAVLIPAAIIFNLKAGLKYREKLAQQLHQLRISKMLNALGIDITQYLHQEQVNEIRTQMDRCSECQNTDQCDDQLDKGSVAANEIAYCNNEEALQAIATRQQQSR